MKASVAIVGGHYTRRILNKALEMVEAKNLIRPGDKVLVKPNCVVAKHPSTGLTTDPRVVEHTIEFLKSRGVEELCVAEGGAGRTTEKAFAVTGIKKVTKRQRVNLVDLNLESRIEVQIESPLKLERVEIAESVHNSTCIINVPTLKVHHLSLVTLSMKNLMGTILPKNIMHGSINEKIVDLASVLKDKVKINIVDALVGAETNEIRGDPVEMNLIIAGSDMVAVDTVSTAVMGIDPGRVEYLQLAAERGLGVSDLKEIEVLGERIDTVKKKFKLPPEFLTTSTEQDDEVAS